MLFLCLLLYYHEVCLVFSVLWSFDLKVKKKRSVMMSFG